MSRIVSLLVLIVFGYVIGATGQEVPAIIAYNAKDYGAAFQNWDIDQDCNGLTYIANSNGVLIFNGLSWQLIQLPHNKRPRTIFVGLDCKVYVAGYEFFGYLDNTFRNTPVFVSLGDSILNQTQQEIWAMYGDERQIVFQSFADVYQYDYSTIHKYLPPENIMLGNKVNNDFVIPKISGGILKFVDGAFIPIKATSQFSNNVKIAAIVEGRSRNEKVIATQFSGLFVLDTFSLNPVINDIVSSIKADQINRVIRLRSGNYVIGTILNGLYVLDQKFNLVHHINKSNGLSNNTVLALYESEKGDLWVGLDKGINLIKLAEKERYYYDKQGKLGTVYASVYFNGELFLGTNQGVFKKKRDGTFDLIKNSQGQVWSFAVLGSKLICGHNNGSFIIENGQFIQISDQSGGLCFQKLNDSTLIQSTYAGLNSINYKNGKIAFNKIEESGFLLEKFMLNGHQIIGFHTYFGLYDIQLSDDYSSVIHKKIISKINDQEIANPSILNHNGLNFLYSNNLLYEYNNGIIRIVEEPERSSLLKYEAFSEIKARILYENLNLNTYTYFDLNRDSLKETIIGFDEGYKVFYTYDLDSITTPILEIDYGTINGHHFNFETNRAMSFKSYQNDILICLKSDRFGYLGNYGKYQLLPWDSEWRPIPANGKLNFLNLKYGDYTLNIIPSNANEFCLVKWSIAPKWYESWKGLLIYAFLFMLLVLFLDRRSKIKMEKELQKLELEKQDEAQKERLKVRAENLERDLMHKSKMLANRTMTLVQKNKMLHELKQLIDKSDTSHEKLKKLSNQKIVHLIENNINSDHDWEIFEKNFAEVHHDFLSKLRSNYPEITSSELRLSAYIKMNLSSKEIAPLMNISVRSIENKRYRLRKKLNVPSDVSLSDFIFKV